VPRRDHHDVHGISVRGPRLGERVEDHRLLRHGVVLRVPLGAHQQRRPVGGDADAVWRREDPPPELAPEALLVPVRRRRPRCRGEVADEGLGLVPRRGVADEGEALAPDQPEEPRRVERREAAASRLPPPVQVALVRLAVDDAFLRALHVAVLAVVPRAGDAVVPHPLPVAVVTLQPSWKRDHECNCRLAL